MLLAGSSFAQLNWEGQTGAVLTPFAYTSSAPAAGLGRPQVSFHFVNGGDVIGNGYQISVTEGLLKRFEVGYTRTLTSDSTPLFENGFNTFHGKANLVPENAFKAKWIPALSVGFVAHTPVQRAAAVLTNTESTNGEFYFVGTKTITQVKGLPIVLSGGLKGTNAALFGLAGETAAWKARAFGAAAFVVPGPMKSKLVLGSEAVQQNQELKDLPGVVLPTSLTYFVRVLPNPERPINIDLAVAQVAGRTAAGDLDARARFAMGVSYHF